MTKLSKLANRPMGQPMFDLLDKAQKIERLGHKVLHFELGDPDFDTPNNITEATIKSLKNGDTHYTSSSGCYEFKNVVQKTTIQSRGFKPSLNQILIHQVQMQ